MAENQFLIYSSETPTQYYTKSKEGKILIIPKNREVSINSPFLSKKEKYIKPLKYTKISFLGLPLGGILTIVSSSLALINLTKIKSDKRAKNLIFLNIFLLALGIPIGVIFVMHIIF